MSATSKSEPGIAGLQDDIAALKRDMSSLVDHLKLGATSSAQSDVGQIDDAARRAYGSVSAEGEKAAKLVYVARSRSSLWRPC